jgi:Protein of unknown function with PCYCGC motif
MARKNNLQPAPKVSEPEKKKSNTWLVPAIVAVVVAGVFFWAFNQSNSPAPQPAASVPAAPSAPAASPAPDASPEALPAFFRSAEAAKPYPKTLPPAQFDNAIVARAYAIARVIPGVLAQEPCFCYCSKTIGHRGLLDCWSDTHGSECAVCLQEAVFTDRLTKLGRTPAQIRSAIIEGQWRNEDLSAGLN